MRLSFTLTFFLTGLYGIARAQSGVLQVIDADTRQPLSHAVISTRDAARSFAADEGGVVRIMGVGGPYVISHIGYQSKRLDSIPATGILVLGMQALSIRLTEVEVLSPLARFRQESEFNRKFFRRSLAGAKFKPGKKLYINSGTPMGLLTGVEWSGVLDECALRVSGKKKQYRRFAKVLRGMESRKLSSIRYTTTLVSEQTGLDEIAAMRFIASNELTEDYLRNATDLELKMRIRELYRGTAVAQMR